MIAFPNSLPTQEPRRKKERKNRHGVNKLYADGRCRLSWRRIETKSGASAVHVLCYSISTIIPTFYPPNLPSSHPRSIDRSAWLYFAARSKLLMGILNMILFYNVAGNWYEVIGWSMQVKMERVPSIPQSLFIPIQFLKQQNKVMCALLEPSAEQLINPRDIHPLSTMTWY